MLGASLQVCHLPEMSIKSTVFVMRLFEWEMENSKQNDMPLFYSKLFIHFEMMR